VAGHADGIATIVQARAICLTWRGSNCAHPGTRALIATKGSITLDGVSLTVNTVEDVVFRC